MTYNHEIETPSFEGFHGRGSRRLFNHCCLMQGRFGVFSASARFECWFLKYALHVTCSNNETRTCSDEIAKRTMNGLIIKIADLGP